jgi:hypothetical protein
MPQKYKFDLILFVQDFAPQVETQRSLFNLYILYDKPG